MAFDSRKTESFTSLINADRAIFLHWLCCYFEGLRILINDTPLDDATHDKLGFGKISHHLAQSFFLNDLSQGFVVGVEGAWGSGKSSLVNMSLDELEKNAGGPKVVKFAPWLVGNRDELLSQLFAILEPVILESVPDGEQNSTKDILGRYAQASSGLAALVDLANLGGVPGAALIASILRKSGRKAAQFLENSLSDLNDQLREKLKLLEHPIVVFVDDLDRLEPSEAAEVLRLVKAVADFPNVAYILAYDPEVLALSIQRAVNVSDGRAYLEKIVQASFKVPRAMNFDLRQWLKAEVATLLTDITMDSDATSRLESAYYSWCGEFIQTPRDVVRVVNSLKLNFIPVKAFVDPGDMVFLQFVHTKNAALYDWIERYVSNLSAVGDWGFISPGAPERLGAELLKAIGKEGPELNQFIHVLQEHIPGLDTTSLVRDGEDFKVFADLDVDGLRNSAVKKRLASPNHYSYYFSFIAPSGSISDLELEQFLVICEKDPEEAIKYFRKMINVQRPQGGRLAEVMLDRIVGESAEISASQVEGLFGVLGETLDELARFAGTDVGYPQLLKGNRTEVFGLIERLEKPDQRISVLRSLFREAKSLAWLTGIIREATFEQSQQGERPKPRSTWLLTAAEFDQIADIFLKRVKNAPPLELLQTPYFLSLMYAWHQLGDSEGSLGWIKQQTATDTGFLNVLERMTSWSNSSSEGVQYKLQRETLDTFFHGVSAARDRLRKISTDSQNDTELREKALRMLAKFDARP